MDQVASGDSLSGLQFALENHFAQGERVTVAIAMSDPVSPEHVAQIAADLRASGVTLYSAQASTMTWSDGAEHPAIILSFARPAMAPADKIGFWPVIILAVGAVAALGYVVYKGGEISSDFMQGLMKLIFPALLLGAGTYIVVKGMETRRSA